MAKNHDSLNLKKDLKIRKIAVFRALHLGDLLAAVPALKALRTSYPLAEITLISLPWAEAFTDRFNIYIDKFIEFPGFPGLPEQSFHPEAVTSFFTKAQNENYDLAIQMQGCGSISNQIIALLGAKNTAGFFSEGCYRPNKSLFLKYPERGHEEERLLKLMKALGADGAGTKTEFPLLETEEKAVSKLLKKHNLREKEFVCIHAGSREEARRWKPANFAETADYTYSKGYKVVFTGSEQEREYVEKVRQKTQSPSVSLAGKTGLGEVAAVLKKSALLVTNDTGLVHIASATGAKSIVIYTKEGSNIERWAPPDRDKHSIITPQKAKQVDSILREIDSKLRERKPRAYFNHDRARAI